MSMSWSRCATSAVAPAPTSRRSTTTFTARPGPTRRCCARRFSPCAATTEAAQRAGADRPPAEQLEVYIAIFLLRVVEGRNSWIHGLMMHELSGPTPALDLVVNDVLRPRMAYLSTIIAALIGSSEADPRVGRCLMSVHAQLQILLVKNPLVDRLSPMGPVTTDSIDAIARHISRFSLAGIHAMADQ